MPDPKPTLTKYKYSGPISSTTQPAGEETVKVDGKDTKVPKVKDVPLFPGKVVELDPEAPTTKTLIARKHLKEVAAEAPAEAPKPVTQKGEK